MISGNTNNYLEAVISINVQGLEGSLSSFESILDTGFDGDLALPREAIQRLGLEANGSRWTMLANGAFISVRTYKGIIMWHDRPVEAVILETTGDSIVGMSLLQDSTLTMQVWDGGDVLIEERARL